MDADFLNELGKVPAGVLTVVASVAGAIGALLAALFSGLIGKLLVTPFLSARDKQDREAEWRKHALELAKLDLERKLKSGRNFATNPVRPSILDFLANYRDLRELGSRSPKELYLLIEKTRTKQNANASATPTELAGAGNPGLAPATDPTNVPATNRTGSG